MILHKENTWANKAIEWTGKPLRALLPSALRAPAAAHGRRSTAGCCVMRNMLCLRCDQDIPPQGTAAILRNR